MKKNLLMLAVLAISTIGCSASRPANLQVIDPSTAILKSPNLTECKIVYREHGAKKYEETTFMPKGKAAKRIAVLKSLPGFTDSDMDQYLACK